MERGPAFTRFYVDESVGGRDAEIIGFSGDKYSGFVLERVLCSRSATGGKEAAHRDAFHEASSSQERLYHSDTR